MHGRRGTPRTPARLHFINLWTASRGRGDALIHFLAFAGSSASHSRAKLSVWLARIWGSEMVLAHASAASGSSLEICLDKAFKPSSLSFPPA